MEAEKIIDYSEENKNIDTTINNIILDFNILQAEINDKDIEEFRELLLPRAKDVFDRQNLDSKKLLIATYKFSGEKIQTLLKTIDETGQTRIPMIHDLGNLICRLVNDIDPKKSEKITKLFNFMEELRSKRIEESNQTLINNLKKRRGA